MKLKSLTHFKGGREVKAILERRLSTTPFQLWGEVKLSSVIGKEPKESLPDDLFDYLTRAALDYLILYRKPPSHPFLAIEFDGRHHETDPTTIANDVKKNLLCRMGGLPLLRVRYQEIEPLFTRESFLSYIVEVILRYKTTDERKGYSPYDEIRRHDLGDVQRLRDQLAKNHCMTPSDRAAETPTAKFAYGFDPPAADYASSETDAKYKSHLVVYRVNRFLTPKEWPVAHRISKELMLRTHYRTTAEPRPPDSSDLGAYVKWLEKKPLYHPDLPGVRWLYVAWNILEGLCLKQLLSDAEGSKLQA